jgi:hypothetical protein
VRFVTLTLAKSEDDLGTRIDKLLKSFVMLRRREFWRRNVVGGLFVVETTRGANDSHWHVHLHVLVDGDYMAQAALKDEWEAVTGDSKIVDIRATHSREKAVAYVCKYISKGSDIGKWSDEVICDYAVGVHRRRLMGTFGKWHKIDVNEDRESDEPGELPRHGTTWAKLKAALDAGTLDRESTIAVLWQLGYLWRLLLADEVEKPDEVTVVPGAAAYHAMTVTLLDIEGVPQCEQGKSAPPMKCGRDWQPRLFDPATKI